MLTAPVFIICIGNERYRGDGDMERVIRDSAIATEHILLQAEHMGLATCWTGWYDQQEIELLVHPVQKKIAIRPTTNNNRNRIQWANGVNTTLRPRTIACQAYT